MQTLASLIQTYPTHYRQLNGRGQRGAQSQVGPSPSGRSLLGSLPTLSPLQQAAAAPTVSLNLHLAESQRPLSYRSGLEHPYSAGIGGPHNRRSVQSVVTSLAALPASLPLPAGKDRSEQTVLKPLPRAVENVADDPSLHNPLARLERLSTGWFGVSPALFFNTLSYLFLIAVNYTSCSTPGTAWFRKIYVVATLMGIKMCQHMCSFCCHPT